MDGIVRDPTRDVKASALAAICRLPFPPGADSQVERGMPTGLAGRSRNSVGQPSLPQRIGELIHQMRAHEIHLHETAYRPSRSDFQKPRCCDARRIETVETGVAGHQGRVEYAEAGIGLDCQGGVDGGFLEAAGEQRGPSQRQIGGSSTDRTG